MIYADNAATTALDIDAFEAMKPYLLKEYGNASQPYSFARPAKKALAISRFAKKDLPLPGVPSTIPLGHLRVFRSARMMCLVCAFTP